MNVEMIDVKLTEKEEEQEKKSLGTEEFLKENKFTVGLFILGIILLGLGVLGVKIFNFSSGEPKVEILGSESGSEEIKEGTITVEAAGEAQKPGVYELKIGSRVNDLLTMAGGLSANADRDWVAKNINMAMKLSDGVKIYIPSETQNLNLKTQNQNLNLRTSGTKININTAPESELDTLWGVGPATAKKIIGGRPYQKPEDLLEKKIVNKNVWEKIKGEITVY